MEIHGDAESFLEANRPNISTQVQTPPEIPEPNPLSADSAGRRRRALPQGGRGALRRLRSRGGAPGATAAADDARGAVLVGAESGGHGVGSVRESESSDRRHHVRLFFGRRDGEDVWKICELSRVKASFDVILWAGSFG